MTDTTKEMIRATILSYCQGRFWLEFSIEDLDRMIADIEKVIEKK